jgi:non-specific serine/threonine protein kinase
MLIWTAEIKELERLHESLKGQLPDLEKELERLIKADDENMVLVYARRCLEVIITDLSEHELKKPRGTEPLKGIIDKLNREEKVPLHIIISMQYLNSLSTFGAHPKEFDLEQVKTVLNNLDTIIKWYLKYKGVQVVIKPKTEEDKFENKVTAGTPIEKSIIVLPFENMSPDPDQEYFSDGLTEETITDLSNIHDLLVISRNTAMTFKGTKKKTKEIASEVNVRYVLEGSVRKAGNNLRITAQLIDALSDTHLWAEKYTGTLDDVFDIQEKVSLSIADALKLKLSQEENQKITEHKIDNIQVYEYYLRAKDEILKFSEGSINKALEHLQAALEITGDNPLLYAGMALAYWNLVQIGAAHEDYPIKAEEYAKKALSIDSESDTALTQLGYIKWYQRKIQESNHLFKSALKVNPNEILALAGIGQIYANAGRISEVEPFFEKMWQIDPLTFPSNFGRGVLPFWEGRYSDALKGCQRLYELFPENPFSQFFYSLILVYNNRIDEAIPILDICAGIDPNNVLAKFSLILKYTLKGDKEAIFNEMTEDFLKTVEYDCSFAHILAGFLSLANLKSDALDWLEIAVNKGFINYPLLNNLDPFLKNIRGEERFKKLMERVKYEWENFDV